MKSAETLKLDKMPQSVQIYIILCNRDRCKHIEMTGYWWEQSYKMPWDLTFEEYRYQMIEAMLRCN